MPRPTQHLHLMSNKHLKSADFKLNSWFQFLPPCVFPSKFPSLEIDKNLMSCLGFFSLSHTLHLTHQQIFLTLPWKGIRIWPHLVSSISTSFFQASVIYHLSFCDIFPTGFSSPLLPTLLTKEPFHTQILLLPYSKVSNGFASQGNIQSPCHDLQGLSWWGAGQLLPAPFQLFFSALTLGFLRALFVQGWKNKLVQGEQSRIRLWMHWL